MLVRITKLKDEAFNGRHPNGINEGYERTGTAENKPTIGERFYVGGWNGFSTSPVTEIIDNNTFRTQNSVYKIEYI